MHTNKRVDGVICLLSMSILIVSWQKIWIDAFFLFFFLDVCPNQYTFRTIWASATNKRKKTFLPSRVTKINIWKKHCMLHQPLNKVLVYSMTYSIASFHGVNVFKKSVRKIQNKLRTKARALSLTKGLWQLILRSEFSGSYFKKRVSRNRQCIRMSGFSWCICAIHALFL